MEVGVDALVRSAPFNARARTAATTLFALIAGAALGALSVVAYPTHFIEQPVLRIANLVATPLAVATCMTSLGVFFRRRGKVVSSLEHFVPAYAFALPLAAVRFFAAG